MKALGGSYMKFFTCKHGEKERVVWRSREISLGRQESGFLGRQKRVGAGFSLTISFQHKWINSIFAAASAQTNVESEEIQTIYSDQPKTVRVRFKLNKECAFGQRFLIVGDDPIIGLWDPSDGVVLNWSEGHVWTAELDIAIGKVIKYKFILKGDAEKISWQPGPDRILETWETKKKITVSEDWDNPELQNIVEEEIISDLNEESLINSDLLIVAENVTEPISDEGADVIKKLDDANGHVDQNEKPFASMVAENITTEELEGQDLSLSDKGSDLVSVTEPKNKETSDLENNGGHLLSSKDEMRDEVVPVLVPGLVPMPQEEIEEAEVNQVEDDNVENTKSGLDEIKDISTELEPEHELRDEQSVSSSRHCRETSDMKMMMVDDDEKIQQQMHGEEQQMQSDILEGDVQWGRRTIRKFLANLGFI